MSADPQIPAVEIALRTDPGRDPDKQVNEDSAVHKETKHGLLAVVCDGMGGHAGGKEAAELAIATIVEIVEAAPTATSAGAALKRAIEEANARIWSMPTAEAGYRPGSTVVGILLHENGAEVAHVGDSRLYLVHSGAISQVTRDHSMVQEMVDRNLIRAEDAAKHPDANKILRAIGIGKEVEVDLRPDPVGYVAGDVFVLCSDGLSDLVEPGEILQIAGSHPPAQAAGQLVDMANARGGHDNITALIVQMRSSAKVLAAPTLLKTIPLTAHAAPPDRGSGPTGSVVGSARPAVAPTLPSAAPLPAPGTATQAPLGYPQPAVGAAIPPAPRSFAHRDQGRSRTPMIILGIVLALVALVIAGALVFITTRRPRHNTKLVDDTRDSSVVEDDDRGEETPVAAAPTLSVEPPKPTLIPGRDGGTWDPCASARKARERDASAATLDRLDAKCRQASGQ
jgi:serine/threonine protein phosphatase PrpC